MKPPKIGKCAHERTKNETIKISAAKVTHIHNYKLIKCCICVNVLDVFILILIHLFHNRNNKHTRMQQDVL